MATETLSIGDELKDSFKPTNQWVKNGVNWTSEIGRFYHERALLELEYAVKLQNLCNESFKKKLKMSTGLSVGDDPVITPGSLESASLVAWGEVLSQTENLAKIHRGLSKDLSSKVEDELNKVNAKYEGIRLRYESFNNEVIKQRDSYYDELAKSKKNYDSLCQSMEHQRQKLEKSSGDRAKQKLKSKETDMNIGKNEYLIKINVANRLKDKYYYQDLPEVLDGLQDLNESRVERLNRIWLNASAIERSHLENMTKLLTAIDTVVKQNNNTLDTLMFIKHNIRQWQEPPDFQYIPSSIWHDDDTIITTDSELYELKKKLNKAIPNYEKLEDVSNNQKNELAEILQQKKSLKEKTMTKEELFKFDDLLTKYLTQLIQYTGNDTKRLISEVEIETIQTAAQGKDLLLDAPIETKKKSRLNFFKPIKKSYQHAVEDVLPSNGTTLSHHSSMGGGGGRLFGSLRDRAQSVASSSMSNSTSTTAVATPSAGAATTTARAAYLYDAAGDDEVSMQLGESLTVTEADDGSGWTEVVNSSGARGLVPSAYIEVVEALLVKKQGPKVAPRKGAKKVKYCEAMYEYAKTGDDELDLQVGQKIVVVTEDDGSGWTEGEVDGQRGLFPTAYVKFI